MASNGQGGGGGVGLVGMLAALCMLPVVLLLALLLLFNGGGPGAPGGPGGALNPQGIPAEYIPWLQKAGTLCPEITAPMVAAQVYAESEFKDHPPNSMGAAGPGQFLEEAWAGDGVDADGDGVKNLHSVADAVVAMGARDCRAWKELAPKYPNNTWDVVLAAYNAGPGNVEKYGGVPPFEETITYVKKIKEAAQRFSTGLANPGAQVSGVASGVIGFAQSKLGLPYVWGGTGPYYDCSGLTQAAYASIGIALPRTTWQQYDATVPIDASQAQPGDLLFFDTTENLSHVTLYLGNGAFIHAPQEGDVIKYSKVTDPYWRDHNPRFTRVVKK